MLHICNLIHPETVWEFSQYLNNDGKGGDDCFEFTARDRSCIQFNVHQPEHDEIRCYLKGDWDNDEVPKEKMDVIDEYLASLEGTSKASKEWSMKREDAEELIRVFNHSKKVKNSYSAREIEKRWIKRVLIILILALIFAFIWDGILFPN